MKVILTIYSNFGFNLLNYEANFQAVSADDLNAIRRNASAIASGTHHVALPALPNGHLSITNSLPQTNNGRSIRTVYY